MAKKRRGRRTRAATGGQQEERAHRASTNKNNTKGGSASRTKATDLKYNPKLWEAHKYIIINYFNDSLCGAVLSGEITEPEIEPQLAIALRYAVSELSLVQVSAGIREALNKNINI